ncbi:pyruvoyl-dependent arginine decarboxylase [Halosegnis sp.]|uniref:pyruvoyl-dependent arginine decarboxylase n=1 Tax=Halosegnis sp. TaxID=2864959 RepID=UPI0035D43AE4
MEPIRVVWGTGAAPTAMAAYDAALADAGVADYNLVTVSSVVPAGASVEPVGTAPELGAVGDRLTVVQARAATRPGDEQPACAGLAWAVGREGGLFYEASGTNPADVRATVQDGLAAGERLRDWPIERRNDRVAVAEADSTDHRAAAVLAVYGSGESLL